MISKPRVKLFNCYAKSIARGHAFTAIKIRVVSVDYCADTRTKREVIKEEEKRTTNVNRYEKKSFANWTQDIFDTFERYRNAYIGIENVPYVALSQVTWDFAFYGGRSTTATVIIFRIEWRRKILLRGIFYVTRMISDIIITRNYSRTLRMRFHLHRMFLNRILCFVNVPQISKHFFFFKF